MNLQYIDIIGDTFANLADFSIWQSIYHNDYRMLNYMQHIRTSKNICHRCGCRQHETVGRGAFIGNTLTNYPMYFVLSVSHRISKVNFKSCCPHKKILQQIPLSNVAILIAFLIPLLHLASVQKSSTVHCSYLCCLNLKHSKSWVQISERLNSNLHC